MPDKTAWEQHLEARVAELEQQVRRLRWRASYQRRRAEMWKLRALTKPRRRVVAGPLPKGYPRVRKTS